MEQRVTQRQRPAAAATRAGTAMRSSWLGGISPCMRAADRAATRPGPRTGQAEITPFKVARLPPVSEGMRCRRKSRLGRSPWPDAWALPGLTVERGLGRWRTQAGHLIRGIQRYLLGKCSPGSVATSRDRSNRWSGHDASLTRKNCFPRCPTEGRWPGRRSSAQLQGFISGRRRVRRVRFPPYWRAADPASETALSLVSLAPRRRPAAPRKPTTKEMSDMTYLRPSCLQASQRVSRPVPPCSNRARRHLKP